MTAPRKRRRKRPGLAWRVLFGQHGPTRRALKAELKRGAARYFGPQTITTSAHDPATQKRVTKVLSVDPKTGVISEVPRSRKGGKGTVASKPSKASRPSRVSRAGQTSRRTAAAIPIVQQPRQPKVKPMSERVLRNPDGTLAGSTKATAAGAQRSYQQVMRHVAKLERQTDRDLGWDREV